MWRMNVSASIQKASTSPGSSTHSARNTSRSKRTWSVSVGRERGEVVRAGERRRAGVERLAVERARPPERAVLLERARARCACGRGSGRCASARRGGRRSRPAQPRSRARPRRAAAARSGCGSARARPSWLATWPRACTPRSVRPATVSVTSRAQHRGERVLDRLLHACAGPAGSPSRRTPCRRTRAAGGRSTALAGHDQGVLVLELDRPGVARPALGELARLRGERLPALRRAGSAWRRPTAAPRCRASRPSPPASRSATASVRSSSSKRAASPSKRSRTFSSSDHSSDSGWSPDGGA